MELRVFKDYGRASAVVADIMSTVLAEKPDAVLCMASGDSPRLACALFCEQVKKEATDCSRLFLVGLDEWVGVPPATPGACSNDFRERLIEPLGLKKEQYHFFNGLASDLREECIKMDTVIAQKGGIDLMVVGVGMNGHIGFNEPGVDAGLKSHVIGLDAVTKEVGQKYFQVGRVLNKGITLGLSYLMEAKKVVLIASGAHKSGVIKKVLTDEVSSAFPATLLRRHGNSVIITDEDATAEIRNITHL
ncbi:hypothetical protein A8C56_22665 [Niabella ginsenosidivorans]|uniref:Glucosamine/galactosamine-6-phosphate isomerase domain-containing protein n=1 Tax=Niabella ginsenosidivorans TaxID=1176587 RepID=A0A1A9I9R1_9BACT|nr:glucosamine-6-phosphate deaminase [Niabella ginsenosidivorans]ANH83411.1 hypothetical protein A8C56_22665 [Niabella ginsenosidivorans]